MALPTPEESGMTVHLIYPNKSGRVVSHGMGSSNPMTFAVACDISIGLPTKVDSGYTLTGEPNNVNCPICMTTDAYLNHEHLTVE